MCSVTLRYRQYSKTDRRVDRLLGNCVRGRGGKPWTPKMVWVCEVLRLSRVIARLGIVIQ